MQDPNKSDSYVAPALGVLAIFILIVLGSLAVIKFGNIGNSDVAEPAATAPAVTPAPAPPAATPAPDAAPVPAPAPAPAPTPAPTP